MSDRVTLGDFEDRKRKRKIEELYAMDTDSESILHLSLGGNNMVCGSSSKITLKSLMVHEDSGFAPKLVETSNDEEVIRPKEGQFSCKFCDKKFPSAKALGGHQNAHRRERILSKMEKEFFMNTLRLDAHICPSAMANHLPFYGLAHHHGAHMHPMTHMSAMRMHPSGFGYGNQGLYNTSFLGHQFGVTSNSWGTSIETPQILNYGDMGFNRELDQVPSHEGNVVNRSVIAHVDLENLQGNNYAGYQ